MKNLPENHAFIHELLHNQTDIANFFVSGQNPTNLCWEPWLTPFSLIFCGKIYITSGPITSWQIDGETMETARDFIFLGSKITADGDCSHEIKRSLLLERKAMTNLDSIFKSRDITLPTKVHLVKSMVFTVVMYGCESQTIKKVEHQRIDAFELWCWRRLFSLLYCKEIQPVCPKRNQS